ncbi:hypothetical protein N7493_002206 [Penicillium malachiteum]|uniref:Uncharacterized protein n=1 Tax=Penicillium malachiteum TaxID=1324776 RepID=A0AAD6MYR3_9EURO|nr:hypothetical protein N7493_002206 [Penicillium malachiteum]
MCVLKVRVVSATKTFIFSCSALPCLNISDSMVGVLTATNNGAETCSGNIDNGDENLDLISGFSLAHGYGQNFA